MMGKGPAIGINVKRDEIIIARAFRYKLFALLVNIKKYIFHSIEILELAEVTCQIYKPYPEKPRTRTPFRSFLPIESQLNSVADKPDSPFFAGKKETSNFMFYSRERCMTEVLFFLSFSLQTAVVTTEYSDGRAIRDSS